MKLRQAARHLAVIPLLALVILGGALIGAPDQLLPTLWKPRDRAVVSGLVTKAGEPLAHAMVNFHAAGGRIIFTSTDAEGRYEVKLPEGTMMVAVLPPTERHDLTSADSVLPSEDDGAIKRPRRIKPLPLPPPIVPVDADGNEPAQPLPVPMPIDSTHWSGSDMVKAPMRQIILREGRQTLDLALEG